MSKFSTESAVSVLSLRILGVILGYLFTLLIAKTLGANSLGIFAICNILLQVFSNFGTLGLDVLIVKVIAEHLGKRESSAIGNMYQQSVKLVRAASIVTAIILFYLAPIISSNIFQKPYLELPLRIISLTIVPFAILKLNSEALRAFNKSHIYMILQFVGIYFAAILIFFLLLFLENMETGKVYIPVLAYSFAILLASLYSRFLVKKFINLNDKFQEKTAGTVILLKQSFPIFISGLLTWIMGWTDTLALGVFKTPKEVGIYSVALKFTFVFTMIVMAINTVSAPKFANLWARSEKEGLIGIVRWTTRTIIKINFPILIIFILFSEKLLKIFGDEFVTARAALILLTFGYFFASVLGTSTHILIMIGQQRFYRNASIVSLALNLLLVYTLVPKFGIIGATLSNIISLILLYLSLTYKVKETLGKLPI